VTVSVYQYWYPYLGHTEARSFVAGTTSVSFENRKDWREENDPNAALDEVLGRMEYVGDISNTCRRSPGGDQFVLRISGTDNRNHSYFSVSSRYKILFDIDRGVSWIKTI